MLRITTKQTWACYLLGALLLPFTQVQSTIALAAWLAPIFLLRFVRSQPARRGLLLLFAAQVGASLISLGQNGGLLPPPTPWYIFIGAGLFYGLAFSLPYISDRLLSPYLGQSWFATFVFPLSYATLDWLMSFGLFPTWGSLAYSQVTVLPVVQFVSLAGIYGLTFIITWTASAINFAWAALPDTNQGMRRLRVPALVVVLVLLYGGIRLTFLPLAESTVHAVGIAPQRDLWGYWPAAELSVADAQARDAVRQAVRPNLDDLFDRTASAAAQGADLVAWAETAAIVLAEDEANFLARAAQTAQNHNIYLQVGVTVLGKGGSFPYRSNQAILFGPNGELLWDYAKSKPVPNGDALEIAAGSNTLPTADTRFGRWTTAICFDASTPALIRQAGQQAAALLLIPADDWQASMRDHATIHLFRAVENGSSLLRPTVDGLSLAVDPFGRTLAWGNDYAHNPVTIHAYLPTQGVWTLYPRIGDVAGYGSGILLLSVVILVLLQRLPALRTPRSLHYPPA